MLINMGSRVASITRDKHLTDAEMKAAQGSHLDIDASYLIVKDDIDVLKRDGTPLLRFRKKVLRQEFCQLAMTCFKEGASKITSANRGFAAGKARDQKQHFERSSEHHSIVAGYIDSMNWSRPCRLTYFSKHYFEDYTASLPFLGAIDAIYQQLFPDEHARQLAVAQTHPDYQIAQTAFSTVTVNYNFRTAVHRDRGDFKGGFGNLVVCGHFQGGYLMFPQYKVAVDVQEGDFLGMDVHEYHCNSPLLGEIDAATRLSFVCYLRNNISKCSMINRMVLLKANKNTDELLQDILGKKHKKQVIGEDGKGKTWYKLFNSKYEAIYYNKQYTIIDKTGTEPKVYKNLHIAYENICGNRAAHQ
jgi:hypothetical protein